MWISGDPCPPVSGSTPESVKRTSWIGKFERAVGPVAAEEGASGRSGESDETPAEAGVPGVGRYFTSNAWTMPIW